MDDYLQIRLGQTGQKAQDYIRQLVFNDIRALMDQDIFLDEETEKSLGQALKEVEEGKALAVKTKKELQDYLESL